MEAKPEDGPGGVVPVSAQWECINLRYLQSACFLPAFGWLVPMVGGEVSRGCYQWTYQEAASNLLSSSW